MSEALKVAVVSRHQLTRVGLTRLLSGQPDRVVVSDVTALDGQLSGHDVVVYDLAGMARPAGSGESDLSHLLAGGTPVLGLEPLDRPDLSEGALTMGVADVVPFAVTGPELLQAVERVAGGRVVERSARLAAVRADLKATTGLTEREAEILTLIASGLPNQEIAQRLYLSINSVKTYVRTAYRKVGVTSRSEAVLWAVRHRLVGAVASPAQDAGPDDDAPRPATRT